MSTTTESLKLFKYDPRTDGEQTFNIDRALNENWDKVDKFSQTVAKNDFSGLPSNQISINNLGVSARRNILLNPFFLVNQRNQSTYSSSGYSVDCWRIYNQTTTVNVNFNGGVTVNSRDSGFSLFQKLESFAKSSTYTLSAIIKAVTGDLRLVVRFGSGENDDYLSQQYLDIKKDGVYELIFDVPISAETIRVGIASTSPSSCILTAMKLEAGPFQTLAVINDNTITILPQENMDYFSQLLACQRFFQVYSTTGVRPSKGIDCRPIMRDPGKGLSQGTILIGGETYYYNSGEL